MRAVIQRVTSASVSVNGLKVSGISKGLMVLVGISQEDVEADLNWIANKIVSLKLFPNSEQKDWKVSLKDSTVLELLVVSQFTLYAKTTKGTKPDFHLAMSTNAAQEMYGNLMERLAEQIGKERLKDGRFGEYMHVDLINDGPVTIVIDSKDK